MTRYSDMGQEERTHDLESRQRPDHDTRANAADAERDALWSTPVTCVVVGHHFCGGRFCTRCGVSTDVAMAIVRGIA